MRYGCLLHFYSTFDFFFCLNHLHNHIKIYINRLCKVATMYSFRSGIKDGLIRILGPVHTNAFSFENAYFFYPFSPSVHTNSIENGGFRKRSLEWRFLKTEVGVFVWTGENGGFRKRLRHWHWHVPVSLVKSIDNRSNMAGYLALMLFALISTLIACLDLNAALINLYTLILRKRMFSYPFSVVKCGGSKTLQKR